jgi:hypothetical protein
LALRQVVQDGFCWNLILNFAIISSPQNPKSAGVVSTVAAIFLSPPEEMRKAFCENASPEVD